MGTLELVLSALRQAGFPAELAYPGQKYPHITGAAAAVHLSKVDRDGMTVEVYLVCPASMGGAVCEMEALKATKALRQAGAVCSQSGCRFDGAAQVYVTPILAAFPETGTGETGADFSVFVNEVIQPYAMAFAGEESSGCQAEYAMGESIPAGIGGGKFLWTIRLEEKIPPGMPETAEPEGEFEIRVVSSLKAEIYSHCAWTSIRRELTGEGLKRIRTGIAGLRKEEVRG